jgi:hypothetical protein
MGNTMTVSSTNIQLSNTNDITLLNVNGLSNNTVFDMSFTQLTLKGTSGTSGYIVMADSTGSPFWTSLTDKHRQDLNDVLELNNDAGGEGITGLNNISFTNNVTLGSDTANNLSVQTYYETPLQLPNVGLSGYFPFNVNGTTFYLQLYMPN